MTHIDLFSGIGGFAYAIDQVYENTKHIFVEIDPFCQAVLRKHWADAEIHGDIRTFANTKNMLGNGGNNNERTSIQSKKIPELGDSSGEIPLLLTGGFPCQPFSQAGRRKGTKDDRFLWGEMLRVIRATQPQWVIAENVRGILTIEHGMVFEQVCLDLEEAGYEVQPFVIPAVAVNAPHRRDRVWFVAHRKGTGTRSDTKGIRNESIGESGRTETVASHPERSRHEGKVNQARPSARHHRGAQPPDWSANWLEVASSLCRIHDGLPRQLDRNPRLKALGNAIVPQVAEEIIKAIENTCNP